ncbi:hypothetical protein LptCag_1824 [Leptospirillum ferriphilum]|uniref:Uncharacterized protein n=1 Tax=Leptospirillum ferriphilum TaxID=178606 RepID=A0A094X3I6_9BACT|nr:hypothetical protein LptCag_1824 [Leptospirillum ferriphilum]
MRIPRWVFEIDREMSESEGPFMWFAFWKTWEEEQQRIFS